MNSRPQRNTYYKPSIAGQILPMLVAFVFVLFFSLPMIETVNAKQFQGTIIKQSAVEWHNTGKDDDSKSYYTQDDIVRVEMGHGDSIEVRIEAREDNESKLPQMGDTVTVMRSHQLISNSEVWRFGTVKKRSSNYILGIVIPAAIAVIFFLRLLSVIRIRRKIDQMNQTGFIPYRQPQEYREDQECKPFSTPAANRIMLSRDFLLEQLKNKRKQLRMVFCVTAVILAADVLSGILGSLHIFIILICIATMSVCTLQIKNALYEYTLVRNGNFKIVEDVITWKRIVEGTDSDGATTYRNVIHGEFSGSQTIFDKNIYRNCTPGQKLYVVCLIKPVMDTDLHQFYGLSDSRNRFEKFRLYSKSIISGKRNVIGCYPEGVYELAPDLEPYTERPAAGMEIPYDYDSSGAINEERIHGDPETTEAPSHGNSNTTAILALIGLVPGIVLLATILELKARDLIPNSGNPTYHGGAVIFLAWGGIQSLVFLILMLVSAIQNKHRRKSQQKNQTNNW